MMQGQEQVFLKGWGTDTFSNYFFQSLSFLHLEITYLIFFFCHHNFMKKVIIKLSKSEPENIP